MKSIYYFLPIQLVLLHFRKYQLLLGFWIILLLIITGNLGAHFGLSSILLTPEYLGEASFSSMFFVGSAMCVFVMSWHITTFIVNSPKLPYMGATRNWFLIYCINNSIIPGIVLGFYSVYSVRYQLQNQHLSKSEIVAMQLGYYLGFFTLVLVSFTYFFRVSRDFFKSALSGLARPLKLKHVLPYDALDYDIVHIPVRTFIGGKLRIKHIHEVNHFPRRVLKMVLERHHRNVIFATLFLYVVLLFMGIFMDKPVLRIPAGAGFLLLLSILMGFVGAFKYFMKSWEALGWIAFIGCLSLVVQYKWIDLRSIAYGLDYKKEASVYPEYSYSALRNLFTAERYNEDKKQEEQRLDKWMELQRDADSPIVLIINTSGGGSRSAYWTFHALQYADSLCKGELYKHAVLITGASGGMIGATYWRALHRAAQEGKIANKYDDLYLNNIGKDLLNPIVFSLTTVDLISPFNKIKVGKYNYTRDRGYAFEQELVLNTKGLLNKSIGYYNSCEKNGQTPMLILNGTIVNDGRKLMMCNQPVGYLSLPEYAQKWINPPIDAVDYCALFKDIQPKDLRLTSALRINATFPFVLPVVRLPSEPAMNVMDAGLRDNFGAEITNRYLMAMTEWIRHKAYKVVVLELRDTREFDVCTPSTQTTLLSMLTDPVFSMQNNWEAFQSYKHSYMREQTTRRMGSKVQYITMAYVPQEQGKNAALNFHLTLKEKEDLYSCIDNPDNQYAVKRLKKLLLRGDK